MGMILNGWDRSAPGVILMKTFSACIRPILFLSSPIRANSIILKLSDFSNFLVVPTIGSCPPFRLMPNRNIEVYNNSYFNTLLWEDCVIQ